MSERERNYQNAAGKIITIFGSARPRPGDMEYKVAYDLGKFLAKAGFTVCNGGYGGVMEASASGAKSAGGRTVGVVTKTFSVEPNSYIDKKIVRPTLVARLMTLIELGDGFAVLTGGTGTLVELAMVWELMNKRLEEVRPVVTVGNFWNPVVSRLRRQLMREGRDEASRYIATTSSAKRCSQFLVTRLSDGARP